MLVTISGVSRRSHLRHWGFHVPAALVAATTGNVAHSDQPTFLLHFGQALNALTLLMVYATTFIAAVLLALLGAASVRDVVNPRTVLTEDADLRAMRWIERNVPRDALFAVDARSWMRPAGSVPTPATGST